MFNPTDRKKRVIDAMLLTEAKGLINKKALREDIKKKEEESYG